MVLAALGITLCQRTRHRVIVLVAERCEQDINHEQCRHAATHGPAAELQLRRGGRQHVIDDVRQLVGAAFGQPVTGFLVGESGLCGPQLLQDLFWGFLVVVHGVASFPVRVEEKGPARRSGLCAGAVVVLLPPQKNSQSKENLTGGPT